MNSKSKSWRDVLPVHPAAELFPLMKDTDPDALRALGEDIKQNGLTSHIALYRARPEAQAQLLDGRNRLDAIEAVIGPIVSILPYIAIEGGRVVGWAKVLETDQVPDPFAFVLSANIHRRHLTAEKRRELIAELIKATPGKSDRQMAEQTKTDHKTVGKVRTEMEGRGEIPHVATRTDTKGRMQLAKKPGGRNRTVTAKPPANRHAADVADRAEARSEQNRRRNAAISAGPQPEQIDLEDLTSSTGSPAGIEPVGSPPVRYPEVPATSVSPQTAESQSVDQRKVEAQADEQVEPSKQQQEDNATVALIVALINEHLLMDNFIRRAVTEFAKEVVRADPETITKSTNGFINGADWIQCAHLALMRFAPPDPDAAPPARDPLDIPASLDRRAP
jgi:hypothetical protein